MTETSSTSALYVSRPRLSVDGNDKPELDQALLSLSVHENTAGLYRCEATLGNWGEVDEGFVFFDRQLLDFGSELSVHMGDSDAGGRVFEGRVMAIEGRYPNQSNPEILFLAEDRFQDLRMTRRSRHFEEVTVHDVVNTLAGEHGLQAEVDIDSPDFGVLTQVNQSDLAFLRDCARSVDAELWIESGVIHVTSRARRDEEVLQLEYGRRLKEFSVMADLAQQCSSLRISGWDVAAKEAFEHEATESTLGSELGGDSGGSSLLSHYFGERVEQRVHHVPQSYQQARSLAEACYRQSARRFLSGHGMADGDARLRVGYKVRLEGLGPLFNGVYYISEVIHSFEQTMGYRTWFTVEKPGLGGTNAG